MNYRLDIQYDGTRYGGWQKQKDTDNTIQGKIEEVLSRMCQTPVTIQGAGRTDAGVHAAGQVANAHMETEKTCEEICEYLGYLGVKIDSEKNAQARGKEEEISTPDSKDKVYVIPTNEELAIARETKALV